MSSAPALTAEYLIEIVVDDEECRIKPVSSSALQANDLFQKKTELPSSNLTPDEISILEYVGGYILRKLKCNGDEEELAILAQLEDTINCFVPSDNSLISILQCNGYGTLLKPNQTLLDVLKFLEINFRNHATLKDTISNAISSLDLSELHDITNNYDLDAYVLQRVGHLFFKIRSFQKAKVLKSKLVESRYSKNISLRKSLK
ncbi:unnamed protein product [Clavelina lepadiformis]|uniref:BTB domain-containing protein n=1 Tax=Clavelina lepadiformis TaxID=159417 RepID=A0ABP0GFW9_CLALP